MPKLFYALSLASVLMISSCSRNPVTGKKELIFMSQDQEIAMGQQYHPSVISSMGLYEDEKLQKFITEKGIAMGKISHRPDLNYTFTIVDSPVVNAFAVPGGFVYFTRGIMAHFNNEAEFAGVLGHEIGHITARHSARQQTSQMLGQVGLMAGMVVSEQFRQMADAAQQSLGMLLLSYGRSHESESDKIGVEYSSKIGYDSHQMANFFNTLKRMGDESGQSIPTFMSTHPDPGDRYNNVHQMSAEYQQKNPATYQVNRDSYLRMIDGIVFGEDPKQGFVENNMFYHPVLKFQFPVPKDWQYENSPIQFQMAPKDGKAMMMLTLGEGKTLDEVTQNIVKQYSFKVISNNTQNINGAKAAVLVSEIQQTNEQGQATTQDPKTTVQVGTWIIPYNNLYYVFHGMSHVPNYGNYSPMFGNVAQSFKTLTDRDKLTREPERVRIKTVNRNSTFKQAMKDLGMPDNRLKELGILNSMKEEDQLTKGMLIKVISK